jgi:hypothetical protein
MYGEILTVISPLRVIYVVLLEHLREDGDGRVDRVRDNEDKGLRARRCDAGGEITADAGVDLEQVITSSSMRNAE